MARPRQVSDDEILEAARDCFLENGAQVSTTTIAERLGVSQAALFKRFGTKQELLLRALMPPALPAWIEVVEHGPDARPIPEQLREIIGAIFEFAHLISPRLSVLKASGCDMTELLSRFDVPPPVRGWKALSNWLRAAQASHRVRAGDTDAMALMLMGAVQGRVFFSHVLGLPIDVALPTYINELIETIWHGLAPRPEEEP